MATGYYNDATTDGLWSTVGNWWSDVGHTVPLGSLPTVSDDAVLSADVSEPAYTAAVARYVTVATGIDITIGNLTATLTTFNGTSTLNGKITGACVFNSSSAVGLGGEIVGDCTFNGPNVMDGSITGDCVFNNLSSNVGSVTGSCTFNDSSDNSGTVVGPCAFLGTAENIQAVIGACTFGDSSKAFSGTITGDCVFNDVSEHKDPCQITGDVTFNDGTIAEGLVTGTVTMTGTSVFTGGITGDLVLTENSATQTDYSVDGNIRVYHPVSYPIIVDYVTGAIDYFNYSFIKPTSFMAFAGTGFMVYPETTTISPANSVMNLFGVIPSMFAPVDVPRGTCNLVFSGSGRVAEPDTGFTVHQAVTEIMSQWGACGGGCSSEKLPEALNILNGCLQEIYINAKDLQYLSNETITVTLTGQDQGLDYFELPDTVQAVVGPVFYTTDGASRIIPGVKTKGQILQYSTLYRTPGKAPIMAYWVESTAQSAGERCNVRLYTPLSSFTGETTASITTDIQREIPRFRESDCRNGTRVPIPHQYAESLLLPLIREKAAASRNASRRDNYQMYQVDANAARSRFGMADPQNPAIDGGTTKP